MIRRQSLGKEPIKSLTSAHRASLRSNDPDILASAEAIQDQESSRLDIPASDEQRMADERKQSRRSISSSIPPFSRQLIFTTMDFVAEEEVWENESWKTVRRIWSSPMLGVPKYAKRGNEQLKVSDGRVSISYLLYKPDYYCLFLMSKKNGVNLFYAVLTGNGLQKSTSTSAVVSDQATRRDGFMVTITFCINYILKKSLAHHFFYVLRSSHYIRILIRITFGPN
jgi:hypothetical protein